MMLVDVNHIFKTYGQGKNRFQSLNDVTFSVEKSELVVILGASGSGKSTLLNVIGSVDRIDSGLITVDNRPLEKLSSSELVAYRRDVVGFIFQMYQLVPNLTVYENIELAANISSSPFSIQEMIEAVGLSGLEKRFPRELSGGQQQRVSIARAIVKKPQLLLCDEPTGALDSKTSKDILSLIRTINQKYGMTVLLVTHNAAISRMADRTLTIKDGAISSDVKNGNVQTVGGIEL